MNDQHPVAGKLLPGYQAKPGSHLSKDAVQAIGAAIDVLNKRKSGATPDALVEFARKPSSPIHRYFEWNDKVAAAAHRLSQARYYLRSIVVEWVTEDGEQFKVRAFNPIVNAGGEVRWPPLRESIQRDGETEELLERAKGELRAFRIKYARLRVLADGVAFMKALDGFLDD